MTICNILLRGHGNSRIRANKEAKLEKALLRVYCYLVEVMFAIRSLSRNWSRTETPLWSIEKNRNLVENR